MGLPAGEVTHQTSFENLSHWSSFRRGSL